ncbi:unnamed protein product [Caenorhabditis nigoni]
MAATPLEGEELESQLRRNQRERNRLHTLNSAYHDLKKKILHMVPKPTRRVSKVKILQYAIQRIRELQSMLPAETDEDRMRKKEKIKRRRKRIFEQKFLPLIKEREKEEGQRKEPNLNNLNHCQSVIEIFENPFPLKETEKEDDLEIIMADVEPKNQRKMSNEEDMEVAKIMEYLPNFTLCPSSDPSTNYQNDPYFQPTPPEEMSLMESDESDEKLYNSSSYSHDNLLFSY